MTEESKEFVRLVREFLARTVDWDTVHKFAVEMEWRNRASFPDSEQAISDLHMAFLADPKDDPQFRATRNEVAEMLERVNS